MTIFIDKMENKVKICGKEYKIRKWGELENKHPEHMCECCEMKYKLDERDLCEDCL